MNAQNISAQIRRLNLDENSLEQNLNARGGKFYGIDKAPPSAGKISNLSGSNLANAANLTASHSSNLTPNLSPKPQSGDYAIDVRGLTKKFGKKIITDNIDIRVKKGSVCERMR